MNHDTTPAESVKTVFRALRPEFDAPELSEWARLCTSLITSHQHHEAGVEYDGAPSGFAAAEQSLGAVIEYLSNAPGLLQAGALLPLGRLLEALRDLDEGRKVPLLATRTASKRPTTARRRAAMIGMAARCMTELVDSGDTVPLAAKKVCAALKAGEAIDWKKLTVQTVQNWRARCEEGEGADIAPHALLRYREPLPPGMGDTPALRAKSLLLVLSEAKRRGLGE
ncbi:hypothetical protein [Acidocella aquatica]|nr:hypothetical protein [Acidocella aquatica]